MNYNFLICNTCENKEEEESLLCFVSKNTSRLNKNNKIDAYTKSLLSSSDNNNSTINYLDIIEYPYNYDNTDINIYAQDPLPPPPKSIIAQKKALHNDDDFLAEIKPPKLFTEEKKDNKRNQELIKKKVIDEFKNKKEIKEFEILKQEEKDNMNDIELDKKQSINSSSLINIDDNFIQNKANLNDYYLKYNSLKNNNEKEQENICKNSIKDDNSHNINNNKNFCKNGKEDNKYSHLDIKSNNNIHKNNKINKEVLFNSPNKREGEAYLKNNNNLIKYHTNIFNVKITKNKRQELKNKSDFEIYNKDFNKSLNPSENNKKEMIKVKLNKKFRIRKIEKYGKPVYSVCSMKNSKQNSGKEISRIKTEKKNKKSLYCLPKDRHCSNSYFSTLVLNKVKATHRNTFSNYTEKNEKKKLVISQLFRPKYQVKTYSSKKYVNPFATAYNKKKNNYLYAL